MTRRIVVGTGPDGRSAVQLDGPPPTVLDISGGDASFRVTELWSSPLDGVDPDGPDPTITIGQVESAPAAIAWRHVEVMPSDGDPFLHATPTVDYTSVVRGNVELVLENGSITLGTGDVVVLRGQAHAWRALGGESVTLSSVNVPLRTR